MAGLLKPNDAMPEDPAVMAPAEGVEDGEAPNVTPEEQKAYEDFVNTGLELIYPPADSGNEDVNPAILSRLKGEGGEGAQPDAANAGPPLNEISFLPLKTFCRNPVVVSKL